LENPQQPSGQRVSRLTDVTRRSLTPVDPPGSFQRNRGGVRRPGNRQPRLGPRTLGRPPGAGDQGAKGGNLVTSATVLAPSTFRPAGKVLPFAPRANVSARSGRHATRAQGRGVATLPSLPAHRRARVQARLDRALEWATRCQKSGTWGPPGAKIPAPGPLDNV
jgi:hypothetical protein